jgi:hypothetical protein
MTTTSLQQDLDVIVVPTFDLVQTSGFLWLLLLLWLFREPFQGLVVLPRLPLSHTFPLFLCCRCDGGGALVWVWREKEKRERPRGDVCLCELGTHRLSSVCVCVVFEVAQKSFCGIYGGCCQSVRDVTNGSANNASKAKYDEVNSLDKVCFRRGRGKS